MKVESLTPMTDRENFAGREFAILGGLGFIGSHLCRALVERGARVKVFDRLSASHDLVHDIETRLEIFEADMMQPGEVLDVIADSETVVDLVHTTRPGSSMRDPAYDITSNMASHVQWLRHLPETNVRRIMFMSSGGTVYGIPNSSPISEEHPTNPICSYGITKLALEKYFSMYAMLAGIRPLILRPANVYGAGSRLNVGQGVIGVLADRALRGERLEIWGDGRASRDYLYIDDLIDAILALMKYEGDESVFNVSSGEAHSVLDVIEVLRDVLGDLPEAVHLPSRDFDVPVNVLNSARLTSATGWQPKETLRTGVPRVVRWLQDAST